MIQKVSLYATTHFVIKFDFLVYAMYLLTMKNITTLKALINSIDAPSKKAARKIIAEKIGLKEPTIKSLANGTRRITAENATHLSKAFPIKRSSLRPDLFDD
ncbi:hypothetical protein [Methylocucumis oryzae]|uniref:Uncharacterized protein n=1 Tax=Methylocucumis oryzae TaxID=1632867 RepID=A0A0F3IMS7_9GAMM|nr:hypothetical protein [Methylocucumis oryzae]KJV08011.1 hypothetical protein VZ94_00925 [Methylocucumis oryzae]